MMTKQSFNYTGSSTYKIDNVVISNNNIAIFDQLTGVGGVDYMPYDGSTVTVKAGDNTGVYQNLAPTLNNKLYYYVSDVLYGPDDKNIIMADATEIPVVYVSGEFVGSFVFSNPNDYPYLYLFWNYNDSIDGSTNVSYTGSTDNRPINWTIGTGIGIAGINYNVLDVPTRFQIKWNGSIIADSGYIGLNSLTNYNDLINAGVSPDDIKLSYPYNGLVNNGNGSLRFKKNVSNVDTAEVIVSSPLSTSTWIINKVDPYLTPFYIDITNGSLSNVCTQCPNIIYYHDGFNLTPQFGDIIYVDSLGSSTYDGNNSYHMMDISLCTVPSPTNKSYVLVDEFGVVNSIDTCNCPETAVPIIIQGDIFITVGEDISIPMASLGSPTSFNLTGSCYNYSLNGGVKSTLFSYVDCSSNTKYITVSSNQEMKICSSSSPTIINGDGSFTTSGQCSDISIAPGLSLGSDGILSGIAQELTNFSFTVTATNCFGTSDPYTINVFVSKGDLLTPFSIDIEQYKETSSDCCSITPSFSILYSNGKNNVPTLRDRIYKDQNADQYFNGGDFWYFIDKSDYVIKIDNDGYVVDYAVCTGSTTTTTTTSTTTIPSVGNYYEAISCIDNTTTAILLDTTSSFISIGNVVKTQDGNCWTIGSTSTGGFPYFQIENPVVIYANCTTCTGTTTTTTSTTTTTIPPIASFTMDDSTSFSSDYSACVSGVASSTYYFLGYYSMPLIGDIVYSDALCTTYFNGGFSWFYATDGSYNYAIQIANTGQVLHVNPCSVVTTTTTTTTIPTFYYNAILCSSTGPSYLLAHLNISQISSGLIVRCDDGNCYEIISPASPGTQDANVLFLFDNCSSCLGTTTTTSTTTTTTTTTSTTTTTTTIKPIYASLMNFGLSSEVCSSPVVTFYIDGPIGVPGNNIYDSIFATDFAPENFYKLATGSIAYKWDGTEWTGISKNC